MTTDTTPQPPSTPSARRGLRPWQRALAAVSIVIAVVGAGLWIYAAATEAPAGRAAMPASPPSGLASGFAPSGGPATEADPSGEADTSGDRLVERFGPAVFKLGFGFFAGFALGYALRAFIKVTLIIAGVVIAALFALQYAGLIAIDWQRMSGGFDTASAWLADQTGDFVQFITGVFPSAAAGLSGAFVGFMRR
jgi:uncharacterized membrane protein (Fun14 family)